MGLKVFKGTAWGVLALVATILLVGLLGRAVQRRERKGSWFAPAFISSEGKRADRWREAAREVSAERGEPVGQKARVEIPKELRHYSDSRRFLAIQLAEWRKFQFQTPADFADLAELVERGELRELPAVGENYVLYGAGLSVNEDALTHYDPKTGARVPLFASAAELEQERERLDDALQAVTEKIATLEKEARQTRDRSRQRSLKKEINELQLSAKTLASRSKVLADHYSDASERRQLLSEYQRLARVAENLEGPSYDLSDADARKQFKVRLLQSLRPAAIAVLEELAASYRARFNRYLPVTSALRTDEYQYLLSKVNPNATRMMRPPHTTGLAFDIGYRYMTADEQHHVMNDLARLEQAGRLEVLRENRNHYHVFIFEDGQRPEEDLIQQSLGSIGGRNTD